MNHIVFNYLPPGRNSSPSPAFSILKSFMQQHNYEVSIKYWIFEIEKLTQEVLLNAEIGDNMNLHKIIPFLCDLAIETNDVLCQKKLKTFIQTVAPEHDTFVNIVHDTAGKLQNIIHKQLPEIVKDDVILFGFSSKFHQWLSAMVLARIVKQKYPNLKTIIGGFGHKEAALSVMKISDDFDFAVWGEGEYILLDVCNQINSANDYSEIPRLIYKENNQLVISAATKGKYLDLTEEIFPDYSDYFKQKNIVDNIGIPIEGSRSCHWKKCKFCFLNQGYKYRRKTTDRLLKEIVYFVEKYPDHGIFFTDNDVVSNNLMAFEDFLDKVIDYNSLNENNIKMYTVEIIPSGFNNRIIKKMVLAGIVQVQIGYESTSDSILEKINKKSSFSDNILLVKFAKKYGIKIGGLNIIKNIPDETEEDILESIDNIQYLRFYLDNKNFKHNFSPLHINSKSNYFKNIAENDINKWIENKTYELTPKTLWKDSNKYDLMEFGSSVTNSLWKMFDKMDIHYNESEYSYRLLKNGSIFFEEYYNDMLYNQIEFYKPEYWEVLKASNHKVCSIDEISRILEKKGYKYARNEIIEIIDNLQNEYILYSNKDYSNIVSTIDTDTAI